MLRLVFRFLVYDKPKSIGIILGIIISTFLVGQQTGIFIFLTSSMSALVDNTDADIWVVDNRTTNANALGQIDVRVGRQVESIPGVKQAHPLIVTASLAKFRGGKSVPVTIIGSEPPAFKGGPYRILKGRLTDLLEDGAISTDFFNRKELNDADIGTYFEIGGKQVKTVLQTKGARGFGANYVFSSLSNARVLGKIPSTKVSAFLVDIEPQADPAFICQEINKLIDGVRAWTKRDFSKETVDTILSTSGIALSVGTLIVFAVISGMIIIGLTMYSAAVDRIRDYGTLKAIGANNFIIRNFILLQAFIFALFGYGIGIFFIEGFRKGIAKSGIIFHYSLTVKIGFLLITMVISFGGALFAMHRIGKLEPASVFRT
jgi:putative ABC transport system permease protein